MLLYVDANSFSQSKVEEAKTETVRYAEFLLVASADAVCFQKTEKVQVITPISETSTAQAEEAAVPVESSSSSDAENSSSSGEDADIEESVTSEEESNGKPATETSDQKTKETWVAVKGHPPDPSV